MAAATRTPAQTPIKWADAHRGLDGRQLIMCVDRLTKAGGTHFALTFPEPIFFLNFDLGLKEALDKPEFDAKDVFEKRFIPEELTYGAYEELLDEAWRYMCAACKDADADAGTVVVDQSTLLWQDIYTVYAGKATNKGQGDPVAMEKILPFLYGDANTRMEAFLHRPLAYDHCSAVFIDRVKPLRDGQGHIIKPEVYERQGYGHMDTSMPLTMRLEYNLADDTRTGIISACRKQPKLFGKQIFEPNYDSVVEFIGQELRSR